MNDSNRQIVIERLLNAPRELVFDVWTQAEHIAQWWGPSPWDIVQCSLELKPGGSWQYCMRGPEGDEHWIKAVFQEVDPPKRIVYEDGPIDADGNPLPSLPPKQVTVTFDPVGVQTMLRVQVLMQSAAELDQLFKLGFSQGFSQTLDQLAVYLAQQNN